MRKSQQINSRRRARVLRAKDHKHRKLMRVVNHKERHPHRYTEIEGERVNMAAAAISLMRYTRKALQEKWRVRR